MINLYAPITAFMVSCSGTRMYTEEMNVFYFSFTWKKDRGYIVDKNRQEKR